MKYQYQNTGYKQKQNFTVRPKSLNPRKQTPFLSHQSSRKSITNSVKTPALLFYKPNQTQSTTKKITPSINFHDQPKYHKNNEQVMGQHYCENHGGLPAKFYSTTEEDDQPVFYCDSCAGLLEGQGFHVVPIVGRADNQTHTQGRGKNQIKKSKAQEFPFPEREYEIQKFLEQLSRCETEITANTNQIRQILINSQQFYGSQIEQINDYFQSIIQSLQLQKNKCYNHILVQRQNAQKQTRILMQKMNQGHRQIQSMMADIKENLDSVYSISWNNYKLVMNTFDSRLNDVINLVQEVRANGITDVQYRKIQFAGVPESINSLSEIIIQNSYGSVNYNDASVNFTDGSLLLTDGESGSFQIPSQVQEDPSCKQSFFEKFRRDINDDSQNPANHLMFSFDGDKIRSQEQSHAKENQCENSSLGEVVELRKRRLGNRNEEVEMVDGIKEVQELDVVVMDEDLLEVPPGLRLIR